MKYILSDDSIIVNGCTLYRIIALEDIKDKKGNILVHKNDKGGFVEGYENLSQEGTCWIYDDAKVFLGGKLEDDAQARNNSNVFLKALICDKAIIKDNANAYGAVTVCDTSVISQEADVSCSAIISGDSEISGYAKIDRMARVEHTRVAGYAKVSGYAHTIRCNIFGYSEVTGRAKLLRCKVYADGKVYNDTYAQNRDIISDISKQEKSSQKGEGKLI